LNAPLRIALLVDPFALQAKGGTHAPALARELLGRGHVVRGFGAPADAIPHSNAELVEGEAGAIAVPGVLSFRPDCVLAYDALSPAAFRGARVTRRLGVPLVLIESGYGSEGRLYERLLRADGERLWGAYVRRAAARVVALDPVARERALREGFDAERVEVLPAGVDLATFRPGLLSGMIAQHHIRGRVLLHVGPLAEKRGLETLIEAFARTVGQRADWTLVLAGDGPAQRRLRATVDRLGIGARVAWLPRPRREELPGLMGASTLFALPALDGRAHGTFLPRALACGLPVLASNLPRLASYLQHDGSGLLVAPGDLAAWVAALDRATGSPEARARWSRRARELAETRFAWPRIAQEFEHLLLTLAAAPERESARAPETA
jgi:glycosyltransferase involved in cell wall biosynthesis